MRRHVEVFGRGRTVRTARHGWFSLRLLVLSLALAVAGEVCVSQAHADDGDRYRPASRAERRAAVERLARRHFPADEVGWAVRVAGCESNYEVDAYDSGYDPDYGYYEAIGPWQIAGIWRATAREMFGGELEEPDVNAATAAYILATQGPGAWPVCAGGGR